MPAVLSRLALPYGVGEDYRIELATVTGRQRGRRMQRGEAHPPSADDEIMPFPDYGVVVEKLRTPSGRAVRVLLHAGYFSDRRFARYASEFLAGQVTRLQAHQSYAYLAHEADSVWMFQLCRRLRTGKVDRQTFCSVLDALKYQEYCTRVGRAI